MIRARDPRLHRISVAYEGFIVPEGIPLPQYTSRTEPLFVASVSAGISSPLPSLRKKGTKRGRKKEKGEETVVIVSESSDDFGILMTSYICHCLSILVTYRFLRLFICPRHVPGALGRRNVASLNTGGFVFPTFYDMMKIERSRSPSLYGRENLCSYLRKYKRFFGTDLSLQFCT